LAPHIAVSLWLTVTLLSLSLKALLPGAEGASVLKAGSVSQRLTAMCGAKGASILKASVG
jgi:hypothetical protein